MNDQEMPVPENVIKGPWTIKSNRKVKLPDQNVIELVHETLMVGTVRPKKVLKGMKPQFNIPQSQGYGSVVAAQKDLDRRLVELERQLGGQEQ